MRAVMVAASGCLLRPEIRTQVFHARILGMLALAKLSKRDFNPRPYIKIRSVINYVRERGIIIVISIVNKKKINPPTVIKTPIVAALRFCRFCGEQLLPRLRSEERRVGKECRSRWS